MTARLALWLFCLGTGILSGLALVPGLITLGMLFVVLPGLVLMVAPYLFIIGLIFLIGDLLFRRLPMRTRITAYVLFVFALLALDTAIPYWINMPLDDEWDALKLNDQALSNRGLMDGVRQVAILDRDRKTVLCNNICQRLLYNGSIDAVSVGPVSYPRRDRTPGTRSGVEDPPLDLNENVVRFHVERRRPCPAVDLPDESGFPRRVGDEFAALVASRVRARIAGGECLIGEPSTLASSDLVVIEEQIRNGHEPYIKERWDLHPNSLNAKRLRVYRIFNGAEPRLIFRQTDMRAFLVLSPMLIGVVTSDPLFIELGIARVSRSSVSDYWHFLNVWSFFATKTNFSIEPVAVSATEHVGDRP